MDKNTLYGVLCMAAIFFGFMYCNKPTQDTAVQQDNRTTAAAATDTVAGALADSITSRQAADLAQAVRTIGAAGPDGSYTLTDAAMDLRLDSTGVTGNIRTADKTIALADLMTAKSAIAPDLRRAAIAEVDKFVAKSRKYRQFAKHLSGENTPTVLENEKIKVTINSRGGMIADVVLKDYNTEVGENPGPIHLFQGKNDGYSFIFTTADQRLDSREFNFAPVVESDTTVLMTLPLAENSTWGIRYTLAPDSYVVKMQIVQNGMDAVLPQSTAHIDLDWHQTMARNEKGRTFEERNSAIYYKYVGESPDDLNSAKDVSKELEGRVKWVAFKNQFFSSVLIPRESFSTASVKSEVLKSERFLKDMTLHATVPYTVADGNGPAFDFYFGPNDYPLLSSLDDKLDTEEDLELTRLIPLGWGLFRYINTWIVIPVFTFLSSFMSSYGLIILLLTIFIKLIISPFTYKSYKSQAKMRVLQPEIKEINDKYPGKENAMVRQQKTMALYSRAGASPFSGCLPLLLQMPILIAMFSFFPSCIELRGQSFLWVQDLAAPDVIFTLPFSIPFYGKEVSLFCLLMTVTNIIYTRINMKNQPSSSSMPGMKWMMYLMPVMFLFFFNSYPAALSYYYFLSLLITIIQTWVFRRCVNEEKLRRKMAENAAKPKKKSGFMARLEEAQRKQQAALREQQKGRRR